MSEIPRYCFITNPAPPIPHVQGTNKGDWVRFDDHLEAVSAAVTERDARIKELEVAAAALVAVVDKEVFWDGLNGGANWEPIDAQGFHEKAEALRSLLSVDPNTEKEARHDG